RPCSRLAGGAVASSSRARSLPRRPSSFCRREGHGPPGPFDRQPPNAQKNRVGRPRGGDNREDGHGGAERMAGRTPNAILQHIHKLVAAQTTQALSDRNLLDRFLARRDEAAFAALVERHGAMVLGVCRRVLRNAHDAEDASQAAFLVLARKAATIRKQESLASWLHGVAYHIAANLKREAARRRAREASRQGALQADATVEICWREMQGLLDEELARLPERYRSPLILCYLEGKTRDEAAQQLGWSLATLRGRLERARERLRAGLSRR